MNPLDTLTQINLDDLVAAFGWQAHPGAARLLRNLFRSPAQTFAQWMSVFDQTIATHGLAEAAQQLQRHFTRALRVSGREHIPSGSFLALSNHPGMSDTLALFRALNRTDLHIIALQRPFLQALPNMEKQLFYVHEDPAARLSMLRRVSAHLRAGGCALTFPAGHIEPDPDVDPGAVESLQDWTDSVGVFIRMSPETAVLPVLVRGAVWKKYAHHPLLVINKTKEGREKLAAALQLLAHVLFKARAEQVRVQIGRPIYAKELGATQTQVIHQAVLGEMQRLIENPLEV